MKVLVIGGTRFIGPRAVERLVRAGHEVSVFHRGNTQPTFSPSVRVLHGDRNDLSAHSQDLRLLQPDVVLDMVLFTEAQARVLMDVFDGFAGRVVVASSQDVYRAYGRLIRSEEGPPDPVPLDEDGPLREKLYPFRPPEPRPEGEERPWSDDYDKILVERVILDRPSLPGTAVRLPAVYGPSDGQHRLRPYLKRMDDGRRFIILGESQAAFRWSRGYVDDMAHGLALCVTDERAAGRVYNLGEENAAPEADWVRSIGDAVSWRGEILVSPDDRLPEELRDESTDFRHHLVSDTGRIRRELGYEEVLSSAEALAHAIRWERDNPPPHDDPAAFPYEAEDRFLATGA